MRLADGTLFSESNPVAHTIVTYSKQEKLDELVFSFLNEGLQKEQLCVYATVHMNSYTMSRLASKIIDYENNVLHENLLVINLMPHIQSLLEHDLTPFEELKKSILSNLTKRKQKNVCLYGDLVSYLFENKYYEESVLLEEWWQNNPFDGTKICPYQNSILDASPLEQKNKIINFHDNIVLS